MKYFIPVALIVFLASCSTPKYAAHFPSCNVDVNYHPVLVTSTESTTPPIEPSESLVASTKTTPSVISTVELKKEFKATYNKLSKQQKKEVRQLLRKEIKSITKAQKKDASVTATSARGGIDHDLKLAAIFGAVGIVGLLISGNVFTVIGAIALIIGVVFFVKWLIRQ
jgi:hypothetical protein